ncbi:MAG: hypothetical protein K6A82_00645 [Prevotella sp.]|nr:hypothetical protein [Prevotella sp.]
MRRICKTLFLSLGLLMAADSMAQTEMMAWGNLNGIRVDGQLLPLETAVGVGELREGHLNGWTSGMERQLSTYHRDAERQIVTMSQGGYAFTLTAEDKVVGHDGTVGSMTYKVVVRADGTGKGKPYLVLRSPLFKEMAGRQLLMLDESVSGTLQVSRQVPLVRQGNTLYLPLMADNGNPKADSLQFELDFFPRVKHEAARLTVDLTERGTRFSGIGGNFRLQNEKNDPKVIDYCLENLNVSYGRVELPWRDFEPSLRQQQPGVSKVSKSMLMAQRLYKKGMPVILSCWFPPQWALSKTDRFPERNGVKALELDKARKSEIFRSLADYMVYCKRNYGVEFEAFSFNESDIGIDVIFTPAEHAAFIRDFGAYMAKRGLKTKLLLGDNSDATTLSFLADGLRDKAARRYVSAVSFHSWRGCDDKTLLSWRQAAEQIGRPLLVGEGSTDAQAWRYPEIFKEESFALHEIELYVRMLSVAHPKSILQWQYTSDYSLLWGDGIYGSTGKLRPTQRFWNLKQLSAVGGGAEYVGVSCKDSQLTAVALDDARRHRLVLHVVNTSSSRPFEVDGLPQSAKTAAVMVTNAHDSMLAGQASVSGGKLRVELPAVSFVTLKIEY